MIHSRVVCQGRNTHIKLCTVCVRVLRRTLSGEYKCTCTCVQYVTILSTLFALMNKLSQTGESINVHVVSCILELILILYTDIHIQAL